MLKLKLQNGDIVRMEHSLKAIAEWESLTCKPYFNPTEKKRSGDDIWLYLNCMTLDDVELNDSNIGVEQMEKIQEYLEKPQTATTIKSSGKKEGRIVTSEQLYATMIKSGISIEYENWNIDRLMTLMAVIADMFEEKKPMTQQEIYEQNMKLNEERRRKLKSRG